MISKNRRFGKDLARVECSRSEAPCDGFLGIVGSIEAAGRPRDRSGGPWQMSVRIDSDFTSYRYD